MAHHFPVDKLDPGEQEVWNTNAQQQQQQQQQHTSPEANNGASSHLPPPPPPHVLGSIRPLNPMNHYNPPSSVSSGGPAVRSSPIAIIRNPEDAKCHVDDSSSDEEEETQPATIDVKMDALALSQATENSQGRRTSSRSLPNHLLRAPRLGSIPIRTDDDDDNWLLNNNLDDRYPNMLPPAAQSSEHPLLGTSSSTRGAPGGAGDERIAYGSLRDSHQRGRFLDGPSSYRNKQTGDIIMNNNSVIQKRQREQHHRVRFQDTTVSPPLASSLPASLSIGERIMKSRQEKQRKQKRATNHDNEPTSSLAALLEASPAQEPEMEQRESPEPLVGIPPAAAASASDDDGDDSPTTARIMTGRTPTFYDFENQSRLPSHMLSTSLTGLEILQSGLRLGQQAPPSAPPPLDLGGTNNQQQGGVSLFSAASLSLAGAAATGDNNANNSKARPISLFDLDQLPRHADGSNAVLGSRSLSDPTPHLQHERRRVESLPATVTNSPLLTATSVSNHYHHHLARTSGNNNSDSNISMMLDARRFIPPRNTSSSGGAATTTRTTSTFAAAGATVDSPPPLDLNNTASPSVTAATAGTASHHQLQLPEAMSAAAATAAGEAYHHQMQVQVQQQQHGDLLPGADVSINPHAAQEQMMMNGSVVQQQQQQQQPSQPSDHDPDTDFAFDLEME